MSPDLVAARSDQATGMAGNGVRRGFAKALDALIPKAVAEPGGEALGRHSRATRSVARTRS